MRDFEQLKEHIREDGVKSKDDKIGFMYLDYYENPNKTFAIPAENGGIFTMEVSDRP